MREFGQAGNQVFKKLRYKGFSSTPEYSVKDQIIYGRLDNVSDYVFYEGDTPAEAEEAFRNVVEDYLDVCREEGREPEGRQSKGGCI